jgi:hypothetical protein
MISQRNVGADPLRTDRWEANASRSHTTSTALQATMSHQERRNMRFRSIATLCVFGTTALVALKYPLIGLGMCICCLIAYLDQEWVS